MTKFHLIPFYIFYFPKKSVACGSRKLHFASVTLIKYPKLQSKCSQYRLPNVDNNVLRQVTIQCVFWKALVPTESATAIDLR